MMEQAAEPQQLIHREACDECHHRKVRCVSGNGACHNCISLHKSCIFSHRTLMGRPRKRKADTSLRELRTQPSVTAPHFENLPTASNTTKQHDQSSASLGPSLISQYMISGADVPSNSTVSSDAFLQFGQNHFPLQDVDFSTLLRTDLSLMLEKAKSDSDKNTFSMWQQDNHSLLDTITILSAILFDLRRQKDHLKSKPKSSPKPGRDSPPNANEILKHVTTLCEVMQACFDGMDASGQDQGPLLEMQSMVHLIIMTVSTTLDIYEVLAENNDVLVAHLPQSRSNDSVFDEAGQDRLGFLCGPIMPLPNERLAPHPRILQRLELVLRLTAMDYQLAQFQWILERLLTCISGSLFPMHNGPSDELQNSQAEVVQLRTKIQTAAEGLKTVEEVERHVQSQNNES